MSEKINVTQLDNDSFMFEYNKHFYKYNYSTDSKIYVSRLGSDYEREHILTAEELSNLILEIVDKLDLKFRNKLMDIVEWPIENVSLYRDGGSASFSYNNSVYRYVFKWNQPGDLLKNGVNLNTIQIKEFYVDLLQNATENEDKKMIIPRIKGLIDTIKEYEFLRETKVEDLTLKNGVLEFVLNLEGERNKYELYHLSEETELMLINDHKIKKSELDHLFNIINYLEPSTTNNLLYFYKENHFHKIIYAKD